MLAILDERTKDYGQELDVTVSADALEELFSESPTSPKKFVWDQRGRWGYENAGIVAFTGPVPEYSTPHPEIDHIGVVPPDDTSLIRHDTQPVRFTQVFRLTRVL